jgi:hypothetical protein
MKSIFCFFSLVFAYLQAAPDFVYLSLTKDPSTSMVVQWVGAGQTLRFQGKEIAPESSAIAGSNKILKRVILYGLAPGREYAIAIDRQTYRFKTLPNTLGTVRFAVGGDVYYDYEKFRKMNAMVAKLSPDFVVLGGDIAYALGYKPFFKKTGYQWKRWETFFQSWFEQMRDKKGRLIPLAVTTGNHDTKGRYLDLLTQAATPSLFYTFFHFDEPFVPYQRIVIANALALILLDSGHTHSISGTQTEWLKATLKDSKPYPYKLAVYHIPAYPSNRAYKDKNPKLIRKHWTPLFRQNGVQAAFENHNHTYKRTYPQNGVIYLGDGSWGVNPRKIKDLRKKPYLEKSGSVNAVFLVTCDKDLCQIVALNNQGIEIDRIPQILSLAEGE